MVWEWSPYWREAWTDIRAEHNYNHLREQRDGNGRYVASLEACLVTQRIGKMQS